MITRLRTALATWRGLPVLRLRGVRYGPGLRLRGPAPIVTRHSGSTIVLGARAVIVSASGATDLGVSRPTILRTLRDGGAIVVGDDVGMSGATICAAHRVTIGDRVLLGADVVVVDTDFHPLAAEGRRCAPLPVSREEDAVVIGSDVFVGTRSIVLKGVSIGDNAVIGAGSVVTSDVPRDAVAAGNPARVLRLVGER